MHTSLVAKDIKVYIFPRRWQFWLVALVTCLTFVGDYFQIYLMLLQIAALIVFNVVVDRDVVVFKLLASIELVGSHYLLLTSTAICMHTAFQQWVSEQFLKGTSAHYGLFSAIQLEVLKSSES